MRLSGEILEWKITSREKIERNNSYLDAET